jgi:L-alanine-DL-glutamate epimerase-like enolase superfamily enzyme
VWWPGGPIGASRYEISDIELVTLDLETDEGAHGFGFTYTVGHGGSAIHALLEDAIVPDLVGRDPRDVEAIWHELHAKLHFVGAGGVTAVAIAAADIALWDALAVAAALPLHRLLGVHRPSIPAYASAVNLALSTAELVEQMSGYRAEGFRAVKLKVGKSLREDVERVRAVREAIGDDCELMVDANMAWDLAEAGAAAARARAVRARMARGAAAAARRRRVRRAAGVDVRSARPPARRCFTPDEFTPYFRRGAIRIRSPT